MNIRNKKPHLACYDYGQGGIWILIDAASPEEVEERYPELTVVHERPPWLDDEQMGRLKDRMHFDIDAPSGWLLCLPKERSRAQAEVGRREE